VEKTFTLNEAQAKEITALGQRHQLLVMEAMWTRFGCRCVRRDDVPPHERRDIDDMLIE